MKISVVLPTYRRPDYLRRCLVSLRDQSYPACEILVGRREGDNESATVISNLACEGFHTLREAVVAPNGNLASSLNAAISASTGDIVAMTDDDAEFPEDWLERFLPKFDSPLVGGVGGKDLQPYERWDVAEVGVVRWWGKVVGNHHLGAGPARNVELLKGVNCCFRGDILREIGIDKRLRGQGNVSNWEMHLSFAFRRRGLRLIFDPAICVEHHVGPRLDGDINARGGFARESYIDGVFNETLAMLEYLPEPRRTIFRYWQYLVGTRAIPGVLQCFRLLLQGHKLRTVTSKFSASRLGIAEATAVWQRCRRSTH